MDWVIPPAQCAAPPTLKATTGAYCFKWQIIYFVCARVCMSVCACSHASFWSIFSLFLLFQPDCQASPKVRFRLWINYSLMKSCLCVCVCLCAMLFSEKNMAKLRFPSHPGHYFAFDCIKSRAPENVPATSRGRDSEGVKVHRGSLFCRFALCIYI